MAVARREIARRARVMHAGGAVRGIGCVPLVKGADGQLNRVLNLNASLPGPAGQRVEHMPVDVERFDHDETAALGDGWGTHAQSIGLSPAQLRTFLPYALRRPSCGVPRAGAGAGLVVVPAPGTS